MLGGKIMEYTILEFSQKAACELGLDITDLAILRWFVNSKYSGKMYSILIDNETYWHYRQICIRSKYYNSIY